jgi:uncharacterized membrane-anchored protein YitT (DUF2179 family)
MKQKQVFRCWRDRSVTGRNALRKAQIYFQIEQFIILLTLISIVLIYCGYKNIDKRRTIFILFIPCIVD